MKRAKYDAILLMCTCQAYEEEAVKYLSQHTHAKVIREVRFAGGAGILHDDSQRCEEIRETMLKIVDLSGTIYVFCASDLNCKHYRSGSVFKQRFSAGELRHVQEQHLVWAKTWFHNMALNAKAFAKIDSSRGVHFREVWKSENKIVDDSFLLAGSDSKF